MRNAPKTRSGVRVMFGATFVALMVGHYFASSEGYLFGATLGVAVGIFLGMEIAWNDEA